MRALTALRTLTIPAVLLVPLAACGLLSPDPPPAPTGLTATALSTTSIGLSWNAGDDGADEFEIERAQGTGDFSAVSTVSGTASSFEDQGLNPGTTYRYQVRACNDGECSSYTSTAEAATFGVLTVTTESLLDAVVGLPYTEGLAASGGDESYAWALLSGSLPSGLTLSTEGIISGTPDTEGQSQFTVEVTSGDEQTASAQLTLEVVPQGLVVKNPALPPVVVGGTYDVILEASGGDGTNYSWSLVSGTLPSGLSLDGTGRIQGTPTATGSSAITLEVESGGDVTTEDFTIDVVPESTGAYDLTPVNVVDVSTDIQPHLDDALARWEEVITGDLVEVTILADQFSSSVCGGFGKVVNGTTIDDILILVNIAPIDGEGNILGQAGPCVLRSGGSSLPTAGFLTLDEDDLSPLVGTQNLTDLIFHEIGHALGYGTLWESKMLIDGAGTETPTFNGTVGVDRWQALGGTGDVPVEGSDDGGEGTADSHWDEDVFDTEIMTGFAEMVGVTQELSEVTVGSMQDLGYTVDMTAADPYSLPSSSLLAPGTTRENLGYDILYRGPVGIVPVN